jgi:ubiquinone/menaquinone biosynthesis C-methylase UbiE
MKRAFIPALRLRWLTPVFDPFMAFTFPDLRIKRDLVVSVMQPGAEMVLDFGCGTGTLALMIKGRYPRALVRGLDIDSRILRRARRKAFKSGLTIPFDRYEGSSFPYAARTFDSVVASFVFHHLSDKQKRIALLEVKRVLRPGGSLFIADFDRSRNPFLRLVFAAVRLLDGRRNTRANAWGLIPKLTEEAGFKAVMEVTRWATPLGEVSCLKAEKQSEDRG